MAWYEIALLVFFLVFALVWFCFVAYDQHKANVAYRKALGNIEFIHRDLVEFINLFSDFLCNESYETED